MASDPLPQSDHVKAQPIVRPLMIERRGERSELRPDLADAFLQATLGLLPSELMGDGQHQGLGHAGSLQYRKHRVHLVKQPVTRKASSQQSSNARNVAPQSVVSLLADTTLPVYPETHSATTSRSPAMQTPTPAE